LNGNASAHIVTSTEMLGYQIEWQQNATLSYLNNKMEVQ